MTRYQVFVCPTCERRRRIVRLPAPQVGWRRHRCSQGHVWDVEMGTLERIEEVERARVVSVIAEQFAAESPFYTQLRRR